jgi:valyl-tRNA synthetase
LPFATDEVWSWWQTDAGSIHLASWPLATELTNGLDEANRGLMAQASVALSGVRKAKSDAKVSMKAEVASATLKATESEIARLKLVEADLRSVGRIQSLAIVAGDELVLTDIVLAEVE